MSYKFVEVEGNKVLADDEGQAIKDSKGAYVPYVEPTNVDIKSLELDALKENPKLAEILAQHEANQTKLQEIEDAKKLAEEEDAKKSGNWEKLLAENNVKLTKLGEDLKTKDEIIGKYKESVETVVGDLMKQIPEDKKTLIPEKFSVRERLEYIMKNASTFGVSLVQKKGDKVDKNDKNPNLTDREALQLEFDELVNKKDRTPAETIKMTTLAQAIKEAHLKSTKKD